MKREHTFVFTACMRKGPWRRVFTSAAAFDGYVRHWRENVGPVEWFGPFECRGAL